MWIILALCVPVIILAAVIGTAACMRSSQISQGAQRVGGKLQ